MPEDMSEQLRRTETIDARQTTAEQHVIQEAGHIHSIDCDHHHADVHIDNRESGPSENAEVSHNHDVHEHTYGPGCGHVGHEHAHEHVDRLHVHDESCGHLHPRQATEHIDHGKAETHEHHSHDEKHIHTPGCGHIEHERAHVYVDKEHVHDATCGHLHHNDAAQHVDQRKAGHNHDHRAEHIHGPGCGHVGHEHAHEHMDRIEQSFIERNVTPANARTVEQQVREDLAFADVAVNDTEKLHSVLEPAAVDIVSRQNSIAETESLTLDKARREPVLGVVEAAVHSAAPSSEQPHQVEVDSYIIETEPEMVPSPELDSTALGVELSTDDAITGEVLQTPSADLREATMPLHEITEPVKEAEFTEFILEDEPPNNKSLPVLEMVGPNNKNEVIADTQTDEIAEAALLVHEQLLNSDAEHDVSLYDPAATGAVETNRDMVIPDSPEAKPIDTKNMLAENVVTTSEVSRKALKQSETVIAFLDQLESPTLTKNLQTELLRVGHYLQRAERLELLDAIQNEDVTFIKAMFERLLEQTRAGLFQEVSSFTRTSAQSKSTSIITLIGKHVLELLKSYAIENQQPLPA